MFCIKDYFEFSDFIQNTHRLTNLSSPLIFLASLPRFLLQQHNISVDAIYFSQLFHSPISENIFFEFMQLTPMTFEFSFDSVMYRQIDGVKIGSSLGSISDNIFACFHEESLVYDLNQPDVLF